MSQGWNTSDQPGPSAISSDVQHASATASAIAGRQPPVAATSSATPTLRLRITALERNRKDMLIRFDASTNLPNFRATQYRNMQRSYVEFQTFAEQLAVGNPHAIVPALPPPQTSAVTDEEDDRLVRISLQRWLTRICEDSVLQRDEELRSFIESDFGYSPVPRPGHQGPPRFVASSAVSGVTSRFGIGMVGSIGRVFRKGGPPDEDEDLAIAKGELEKLEEKWAGVAKAVQGTGKARRALAQAQADSGAKLQGCAVTEIHADLAFAYKRIGKGWENLAGLLQAQAASDNIVLSDSFNYQAANAKAAKDTLNYRTQIMQSAQDASKAAITKRRNAERMKGSTSISAQKVDEALEDLQEAQEEEANLTRKVAAISAHLRTALRTHSRQVHDDAALVLLEHARSRILHERQALKELEALRPDVRNIGKGLAARRQRESSVGARPGGAGPPSFAGPASIRAVGPPQAVPQATAQPGYMAQSAYLPSQYQQPAVGGAPPQQHQQAVASTAFRPGPPMTAGFANPPPNMAQSMYPGAPAGAIPGPGYAAQSPQGMAQSMYVAPSRPQQLSPEQLRQAAEAEAQARAMAQAQAAAARRRQENERAAARSLANMF